MESLDFCAHAVSSQRVLDLSGNVVVNITEPISQQSDKDQSDESSNKPDARDDGVATGDETSSSALSARRPRSSRNVRVRPTVSIGLLSAGWFGGRVFMIIHGHWRKPRWLSETLRQFLKESTKTEVRCQSSDVS